MVQGKIDGTETTAAQNVVAMSSPSAPLGILGALTVLAAASCDAASPAPQEGSTSGPTSGVGSSIGSSTDAPASSSTDSTSGSGSADSMSTYTPETGGTDSTTSSAGSSESSGLASSSGGWASSSGTTGEGESSDASSGSSGSTTGSEYDDVAGCNWIHELPIEYPAYSMLYGVEDTLVWVAWSEDESRLVVERLDAATAEQLSVDDFFHDVEVNSTTVSGNELFIASGSQILVYDLQAQTLSDSGYVPTISGADEYIYDPIYDGVTALSSGDIIAVIESQGFIGSQLHWARFAEGPEPVWRVDVDNQFGATEASYPTLLMAHEGAFQGISGMRYAYNGFGGGAWMPAPGARRFDLSTGEVFDYFFSAFESNINYAHIFSCMAPLTDDVLVTVVARFVHPGSIDGSPPSPPAFLQLWSPEGDLLSTQDLPGVSCRVGQHPGVGSFLALGYSDEQEDHVSSVVRIEPDGATTQVVEDTHRFFHGLVVGEDDSLAILQHAPASVCRVELE